MTEQREKELHDEIDSIRRELKVEKQERLRLSDALDHKIQHCCKLMKERDDLAFRLRKIQAAFDKQLPSHNLDQSS